MVLAELKAVVGALRSSGVLENPGLAFEIRGGVHPDGGVTHHAQIEFADLRIKSFLNILADQLALPRLLLNTPESYPNHLKGELSRETEALKEYLEAAKELIRASARR